MPMTALARCRVLMAWRPARPPLDSIHVLPRRAVSGGKHDRPFQEHVGPHPTRAGQVSECSMEVAPLAPVREHQWQEAC